MNDTPIAQAKRGLRNRPKSSNGWLALPSHHTNAIAAMMPSMPRPSTVSDSQPSLCPLVNAVRIRASAAIRMIRPVQSNFGNAVFAARSGKNSGPRISATAMNGIGMAKI